jgi:hypothetical protein
LAPSCSAAGDSVLVEVNFLPRTYHRNVIHRVFLDYTSPIGPTIFAENVPTWTERWTQKVLIPPGTANGTHSLRFEQLEREDPPNSGYIGTACAVYLNFQVADTASASPWRDSLIVVAGGGDTILVYFDPTNICGIPKCDTIHLVQVIHPSGTDSLGSVRNLTYAEQGFKKANKLDAERTPAGYRVDVLVDAKNPFYTTSAPIGAYVGSPGRSGDTVKVAFLLDAPLRYDSNYPAGIQTITLEFEVCAVCTHGEGKVRAVPRGPRRLMDHAHSDRRKAMSSGWACQDRRRAPGTAHVFSAFAFITRSTSA